MRAGAAIERGGALLLLATSLWAAAWLGREADDVRGRTNARERQLEQLASLMAERSTAAPGPLASFDGLFPGHHVVWQQTAAGPVLDLCVVPDEVRR